MLGGINFKLLRINFFDRDEITGDAVLSCEDFISAILRNSINH